MNPALASLKGLKYSIKASLRAGKSVRVRFDGEDWVHSWGNNDQTLLATKPSKTPERDRDCNHWIFTHAYRPKTGDTVFDVGAGTGTELRLFNDLVGATGRVVSIEADPVAFRCLSKTAKSITNQARLDLLRVGVSNRSGTGYLTQQSDAFVGNALTTQNGGISIRLLTLDQIVVEQGVTNIDFFKMNIEGAEWEALLGFSDHYTVVKNFCISCHDFLGERTETHRRIKQWLEQRGYQLTSPPKPQQAQPWLNYYLYASR